MNKARHATSYIKHLAKSVYFKVSRFNKNHISLIGLSFEMQNISYTSRLEHIQLKRTIISSSILLKSENNEIEKNKYIELVAYVVNKVALQPKYKF